RKCPAGYFCIQPDKKQPCKTPYYCPEGSVVRSVCPEGYYCPNSTIKILCPRNHYCPTGTITPYKCSFLANIFGVCKSGNTKNMLIPLGISVMAMIVITMLSFVFVVKKLNSYMQKRRSTKKEKMDTLAPDNITPVDLQFENLGLMIH